MEEFGWPSGAIGIRSTAGRTGGTYAHKDIAFEFASWVSAEFKLYLIKEFQRLKDDEIQTKSLEPRLSISPRTAIVSQSGEPWIRPDF